MQLCRSAPLFSQDEAHIIVIRTIAHLGIMKEGTGLMVKDMDIQDAVNLEQNKQTIFH